MDKKIPYHIPVLLQECIQGLEIKPEGVYVDVTFGGGGHAKEIFKQISAEKKPTENDDQSDGAKDVDDKTVQESN